MRARFEAAEGPWLAGFAPVGNTEFVVIVQTPYDDAVGLGPAVVGKMLSWGGGALVPALLFVGISVWCRLRRRARPADDTSGNGAAHE